MTSLHDAALRGSAVVVASLVAAGAYPNAKNNNGATPLYWAVQRGNDETAAALRAAGATR